MTRQDIRARLEELKEPAYRDFSLKLLPGVENMLGVRLPILRCLAKDIAKDDWQGVLSQWKQAQELCFEERMLWGMVLGAAKMSPKERLEYIREFLPHIDCWSVCDSTCVGLKFAEKEPELVWQFLLPLFQDEREYVVRFAVVMALDHYVNESYMEQALEQLKQVHHPGYYARMAVAWAVSMYFAKFPECTKQWLLQTALEPDVRAMTVRKIKESRRVSAEDKKWCEKLIN